MDYSRFMMALTVWREARGETLIGKVGVACVIWNRLKDGRNRWPKNVVGVVLQRAQFSCFDVGDVNAVLFPRTDVKGEWEAWEESVRACEEAVMGNDPTDGANHYHAIPDGRPFPRWAAAAQETRQIGRHRFYRL